MPTSGGCHLACQAHNRNRIVAGSNPARPTTQECLFRQDSCLFYARRLHKLRFGFAVQKGFTSTIDSSSYSAEANPTQFSIVSSSLIASISFCSARFGA